MIRIQAIHFVNRLGPEVTKEVLNKQFVEVLLLLAEDPVPNIRFNVSRCIESFYTKMTPGSKFKCESAVKKMTKDLDFDSMWFAKKAMEAIDKL
jgi:serine/threonine-protein phosphatase 2A regulatory subunit A